MHTKLVSSSSILIQQPCMVLHLLRSSSVVRPSANFIDAWIAFQLYPNIRTPRFSRRSSAIENGRDLRRSAICDTEEEFSIPT